MGGRPHGLASFSAPTLEQELAGTLKLGLNTGYWAGGPPPGVEETIAEAERLGFDSIWTAEAYGSDCLTPLAWWGAATERIKLGTAIVQMSARQPAATAMAAMTMDHLSGGRFVLGVGVSGPQVVEGWYGMPFQPSTTCGPETPTPRTKRPPERWSIVIAAIAVAAGWRADICTIAVPSLIRSVAA